MPLRAGHKVVVSDFDSLGIVAEKTADETVTSNTTLQNDDQLFLPVAANARYEMRALLLMQGAADPAGGCKLGWTGPSGATMLWCNFGTNGDVEGNNMVEYNVVVEVLAGSGRGIGTLLTGTALATAAQPQGTLITGSSAGTLQLQFAQKVSNVTGTKMCAGSRLRLFRTA